MSSPRWSVLVLYVVLMGLAWASGCDRPSDDDLRPVVLVTVRGVSSDIAALRIRAEVNGAPAMNEQEYHEGLGSADVAEYQFAVRLPARTRGRLDLSLWSLTADGCYVSENLKEPVTVEPARFQELSVELRRFERAMCPLTVQRLGGAGLVRWGSDRPACADTCTERFPRGQVVTLSADGNDQTQLQQWEGACSGQGPCQVKLSGPQQVSARFLQTLRVIPTWPAGQTPDSLDSLITSIPSGIRCDKKCAAGFHERETVQLIARNGSGLCFIGWGGPCAGTGPCNVTIQDRTEVTAAFAECTSQSSPTSKSITGVWASAPADIWAAAEDALLQSSDGKTWKKVVNSADYTNISKVWSSGPQGEVWFSHYKTGSSWAATKLNPPSALDTWVVGGELSSLWAYTASEIWAARGSYIGRLQGRSFTESKSLSYNINSLHGSAANDIWAVGDNGSLSRWDGTTWTAFAVDKLTTHLRSVWAVSAKSAWAVGDAGAILQWNGSKWSQVPHNLHTKPLSGVWASSAEDVWAVGSEGTILRWDGRVWGRIVSQASSDLTAIHGPNEKAFWIVGKGGTIQKFSR